LKKNYFKLLFGSNLNDIGYLELGVSLNLYKLSVRIFFSPNVERKS